MKSAVIVSVLLAFIPAISAAAVIQAYGSFEINQFGVSGDRDRSLAGDVGGQPGYVIQRFQLPTLGAGESFDDVQFSVTVGVFFNAGGNNQGFDLDLSGLTQNSTGYGSTLPLASMSTDSAALIQSSFVDDAVVTGTSPFLVNTSGAANLALELFLNTQYAGGANAGQTVFFRYSPTGGSFGGFNGFDVYNTTGNPEGGFTEAQTGNASITYSVIPEPSSLAILGMAAAGCGLVRRRLSV